jgi:polyphosphate kinase
MKMIDNEINNAKIGKEAWAIIKLNSLVDETIIRKLYEASEAGVKIKIIARGICVLVPGIKGQSENIETVSIVDKFLEHSRAFIFCNGGDEKYFISSADWMTRNFDHRIEVTCPILDKDIQSEIKTILSIQLNDNTKARIISKISPNKYKKTDGEKNIRSQFEIYNFLKQQSLLK